MFKFFQNKNAEAKKVSETAGAKNVLLCEEDPFYAEAIQVLLQKNGYRVVRSAKSEDIVATLESEKFDLILCAIHLTGLDGFGALRLVQAHPELKKIPFIFLTGVSDTESMDRAHEAGATDYFIKANAGLSHLLELIHKYI